MFGGDAVAYEYVPEGRDSGRIELRWSAPDIHTRLIFAIIRLKQVGGSQVEISITEEKNNVPLTHKFQDVATKLRLDLQRAGLLVR
jgi:hypothetical protein